MRFLEHACIAGALIAALANGQDKPNFSGNWLLDVTRCEFHNLKLADAAWTIEESGNSIHITANDGKASTEMKCTTDGKDCDLKGENAKASFWYNGPILVEMETRGDHVTRYRIKLSDDGKTMRVETSSILPKDDAVDFLIFNKKS